MVIPKRADRRVLWLSVSLLLVALSTRAAAPVLSSENINLAADLLNSDARNDVHVMSGNVRITQGQMSMEAEQATVNGLQTDHSRWTFERGVHIRNEAADLRSDTADAVFASGRIAAATVKGAPATFEQRNAAADKNVHGRARVIEYDFAKGTVKMTQDVWFSYGGNEFRGDTVIYNVNDQRVIVNPGGKDNNSGGRVNITIKPGTPLVLPGSPTKPKPPAQPEKSGNTE